MSKIQTAVQQRQAAAPAPAKKAAQASISVMLNSLLDSEGYRKRFDELLGKQTPQFVSSIISIVTADSNLQEAFKNAPITIVQSALKAATMDLPIENSLGYAYIVPFRNGKAGGRMEAKFVPGYKGLIQLAIRTGFYRVINVTDIREGEFKYFNLLTEDFKFDFIEDFDERKKKKIIGWAAHYEMLNGMTKTVYMTRSQIDAHERANRKGKEMGWGWKNHYESMANKTVLRNMLQNWGLLSINYRDFSPKEASAVDDLKAALNEDDFLDADYTVSDQFSDIPEEESAMIPAADQPSGQIDLSEGNTEPLPWDNMSGISN